MGLLDTLFAGGMQGNPEPDPQEAMLADLFRKLQASQQVQTQGVVNPGSTPAPDTGRVGMFSPSSAAASSAQLPPAVPPLQERPVQDAPQPGVPYAAPPPGMVPQDIAAKMPQPQSQAMQRPAAPPQREANVWDHLGRLSRGYNSGGLVGGVADMMNTGRDQADTNQTVAALGQQLGDPQMARMIMQDPELRKSVVPLLFKQKLGLGSEYGKAGTVVQGKDGKFYSVQFGSGGERKIEELRTRDGTALDPSKGIKHIGNEIVSGATGGVIRDVGPQMAAGSFATTDGKNAAEQIEVREKAVQASRDKLPRLLQMEQLLRNPDVYQGKGGEWVLEAKKLGAAMGIDLGNAGPAEVLNSIGKQFALQLRNPAGGEGMPGAMSDQDRNFLASMVPGLTNTPQGNAMMVRLAIEMEKYKTAQNAEAARFIRSRGSTMGLNEHIQEWSDRNPAISEETKRLISGGAQAPAAGGGLPQPKTTQEAAALPKGTRFIGPDGVERIRP